MAAFTSLIRRLLWLTILGLLGGAIAQWWRERQAPDAPAAPEWPPIEEPSASATSDTTPETPEATVATVAPIAPIAMAETVSSWVEPLDDGSCPIDHPIKANDNSGIFHVPEGRFYARTKAERCYVDAEAATADGYRQAKS